MHETPLHRPARLRRGGARAPLIAAALFFLTMGAPAWSIDRLVLTVGRLDSPQAALSGAGVSVEMAARPSLEAHLERLQVRRPGVPELTDVTVTCGTLQVEAPEFGCQDGRLAARAAGLGTMAALMSLTFEPRSRAFDLRASQVPLAGGRAQIDARLAPGSWRLRGQATGIDLDAATRIARRWIALPAGYRISGHADARMEADEGRTLTLNVDAHTADLNLSNEPGTVVAQQVAASVSGTLSLEPRGPTQPAGVLTLQMRLRGTGGQTLAGPALLDFGANPLTLDVAARGGGGGPVVISRLDFEQRDLIEAHARAVARLDAHPAIVSAHVTLASLRFPAAYTSYLQLALATTELGSLQSSGEASGSIDIANDAITRLDCSLHDVNFTAPDARVLMQQASGAIHWAAAPGAALPQSEITWKLAAAYGLSGGPVHLRFVTWQRNFALIGGASRLPVFDGAVIVHTLVGRDLGTPQAKVDFDADVTPISMPRLSKAFGWPIMNGEISGRIPLVRYRARELTLDGDLVAKVFDGTITGSNIVLQHPLGPWPTLTADVFARGLDLDLVTHTFAFGSMTGRVDVDARGLKLFNWSPVAFDARLYTTPGDRSPHLISQNAVTRIAGLGGAAGAMKAALGSGVLKFFHTFHYNRIGVGCRLRNEVCTMSGTGPAPGGGYYLVKGSGVPRLDIIGNVHRVDWPRLMGQIEEGMRERDVVVNTGGH